jgi:pimeloyl-ACP methyl ester carboxylesterase
MATLNPLNGSHSASDPTISSETFTIAGLLTTVYGLSEISSSATEVACLWLLHPRLQTQKTMAPIASSTILAWNKHVADAKAGKNPKALIAVSFDQRNHGSRLVDPLANEAWRQGNPRHAQDMFSAYHGTATDTSLLITHLPSYILSSPSSPPITQHLVLGVSLGGHAAWHCILQDPRITAAVVGIGCPDYTRVMTDRAAKSKLRSWTSSNPPGSTFLGSEDFPKALIEAVAKYDPAGLLLPGIEPGVSLTLVQALRFKQLLQQHLKGKAILNLSGADDKLVPYAAGKPFLKALKKTVSDDPALGIIVDDRSFEGVGHAFTRDMVNDSVQWICDLLNGGHHVTVTSKM